MKEAGKTAAMPVAEIAEGIYEIDEFDCSSIFVIVGKERALVIDTGIGISGLRSMVESIVGDKPYLVVLSHVHPDHIGGAFNFDSLYVHENDCDPEVIMNCAAVSTRRDYANMIRLREQKPYPYNCVADITEWSQMPDFKLIREDRTEFDLGGRHVKVFSCPGHTPGSILFLDKSTGYLIVGDACNGCYLLNSKGFNHLSDAAESASLALQKIDDMKEDIRHIINSHHDFREFGQPLDYQYLVDTMHGLQMISQGTAPFKKQESPLSESGYSWVYQYGLVTILVNNLL